MTYRVLAVNPGHNGSVAFVVDGELVFYAEEERLSRLKYDGNPFRAMLQVLVNWPVDELVIGGTSNELSTLPWTNENAYAALVRKFNPEVKVTMMGHLHHLAHAAGAFYNSGFESAAAIVVDGSGSYHREEIRDTGVPTGGFETESIYHCSYPHEFNALYKRYSDGNTNSLYYDNGIQEFDNSTTIVKAYEAVTDYLGFHVIEAGKTMGLAPYGKYDESLPPFFINGKGNKNWLIPRYPASAHIDVNFAPHVKRFEPSRDWHSDGSLVREIDCNMAYHVQKETEDQVCALIQKSIDITGETNIVISGGYALNCVANYVYLERFPDCKFYIDPISHDGGTAIGLAKLAWYQYSKDDVRREMKSVYLGTDPDYTQIEVALANIPNLTVSEAAPADVAALLGAGNIVALFQGRAEGGPRALGNRSILFDPRVENGKDIVNRVKRREWFRPFAGSVLKEHASEWFDMRTLESSPFMMYAVNVQEDKRAQIPAVTHVDGTCRAQTVAQDDNPHYYSLIKAFQDLTGVPVVFNTSLNLAGQPLVETVLDAITTLFNSEIEYLYLPEIGKLLTKTNT